MSEVLDNSNKYLNQAKHENAELKMKYNELEQKYLNIKKNTTRNKQKKIKERI